MYAFIQVSEGYAYGVVQVAGLFFTKRLEHETHFFS